MRLDVGCGHRAEGDVNVDPYTEPTTVHRVADNSVPCECKVHHIPNFVKASAEYLPFKDSFFDEVVSHHVIEHVPHFEQMLKEMVRVSKDRVEITCPHRFGKRAKQKGHVNYFNISWFAAFFQRFTEIYNYSSSTIEWRGLPFSWLPLVRVPNAISVSCRVKK